MRPWRIGTEWRVALIVSVLAVAAVLTDATPLLRGPAPYPPEWRWDLRAGASGRWLAVLATGAALAVLAGLPSGGGTRRASAALAAAVVLGWMFQLSLVGLEPAGVARTLMERALSRTATSYLTVAESDAARDPAAFLDHHAEGRPEMRKMAKHAATHPPGPVLFYRGLIGLFEAAPGAATALLTAAGIDPDAGRRPAPVRAAALAGPLLIMFLCAAAAWPLAALARAGGLDAPRAARLAALWPLLPGPALMAPHFDQMLALPVTAAALLAAVASCPAEAVHPQSARTHVARALAAGLCAGIAMQISYGAVAFVAISGAAALALAGPFGRPRPLVSTLALAAGGCALVILLPVAWGHEPIAAARTGLAIHREAYTHPRSYVTWLLFNPLDLAIFAGVPIVVVGVIRLFRRAQGSFDRMRLALAAGLALLLLSGTVRGELGRIAIPLMPVLLVASLGPSGDPALEAGPTAGETALVAILLLALTTAIAARWSVA